MEKVHIWIDCDTGIDDSIALLCAISEDNLIVEGVSAVGGNQTLDKTFKNTRDVLALASREDIKVYKGKEKPLYHELHTASKYHGENGLGGAIIDESLAPVEKENAIDALYKKAKELNGELVIVAVGPLTNIASLLLEHEDAKQYIKKIAIMGGSLSRGNRTPYAEYNAYADSDAAKIVFDSGLDIIMCGLDVTLKAIFPLKECLFINSLNKKATNLFKDSTAHYLSAAKEVNNTDGLVIHDACPILYLSHPDFFKGEKHHINIVTSGEKIGQTYVCDGPLYVTCIMDIDIEKFVNELKDIYINRLP